METNLIFCWLATIFLGMWLTWRNNNDVIHLNRVNYQTIPIVEANYNFINYVTFTGTIILYIMFLSWWHNI